MPDRLARDTAAAVRRAGTALAPHIRRTPLVFAPRLSELTGARVHLKLENLQHTGSFKYRGACHRLLALDAAARRAGVVAASSGNHGAAVARAAGELGIRGIVFVPHGTSAVKADAIRAGGADLREFGNDGLDTEQHAREYASRHGMTYVSPYNDAAVIAGQGTCGLEIAEDLDSLRAVFVAVGGGGLIGGIGSVFRDAGRPVRIIGCQPAASPIMAESVAAGHIVDRESGPTLSDGTAGGIEAGAITFELCRSVVDEYRLVSEDDIAAAMRLVIETEHQLIEGAAGVAVAACLAMAPEFAGEDVVIVICGANISRATLRKVLG